MWQPFWCTCHSVSAMVRATNLRIVDIAVSCSLDNLYYILTRVMCMWPRQYRNYTMSEVSVCLITSNKSSMCWTIDFSACDIQLKCQVSCPPWCTSDLLWSQICCPYFWLYWHMAWGEVVQIICGLADRTGFHTIIYWFFHQYQCLDLMHMKLPS